MELGRGAGRRGSLGWTPAEGCRSEGALPVRRADGHGSWGQPDSDRRGSWEAPRIRAAARLGRAATLGGPARGMPCKEGRRDGRGAGTLAARVPARDGDAVRRGEPIWPQTDPLEGKNVGPTTLIQISTPWRG